MFKSIFPLSFFYFCVFLFSPCQEILSQEQDLLAELKSAIEKESLYDIQKWQKISGLRRQLKATPEDNLERLHELNRELLNEYRVFRQDSAFFYGLRTRQLAELLGNEEDIAQAIINLADISVSAGMYKEALDYLSLVEPAELQKSIRSLYYGLLGRCYSEMAEFSNIRKFSVEYNLLAREYREKALALTEPGTFFGDFLKGYMIYKEGGLEQARGIFEDLIDRDLNLREQALTNFVLGEIYLKMGEKEEAIPYLSRAAIADIKTSTKENLALVRLSELLFEIGDAKAASVFIHKAFEDASFYGAQQRKIRVGAILPLIEEQIINTIEKQRSRLLTQNLVMSLLLVFVIALVVVILFQVRNLKKARHTIGEAHENLKSINGELTAVNEKIRSQNEELNRVNYLLLEANKIKEEYIGFFFSRDADLFDKFQEFKSKLESDLNSGNLDKARYFIENYDLKREKEKLLRNFDEAFIKLFPNFIEEFNSLLKEEEQIQLKNGQLLNMELRIFALIRLGIKHNDIIAQILGYSVNSIYAYKTKIRNRSVLEKKDFDEKLMQNTTLNL